MVSLYNPQRLLNPLSRPLRGTAVLTAGTAGSTWQAVVRFLGEAVGHLCGRWFTPDVSS